MKPSRFAGLLGWILPALILVVWEGLARVGFITANVLPAPSQVAAAFWRLLMDGECRTHPIVSIEILMRRSDCLDL